MAIENINGIADAVAPELEANLVKLPPEALVEGVTELDDGSAIIGEMDVVVWGLHLEVAVTQLVRI